jgi:diguanylate cyclase (GGDEF)-like protein
MIGPSSPYPQQGRWSDPRRWAWAFWLILWSSFAIAYLGVPADDQTILYDAFALAAFAAILVGVRWHRPARRVTWHLLAFGALAIASGEIVFGLDPDASFPSRADVLFISGYLLLALALAGFGRESRVRRTNVLDAAIVLVAATSIIWTLIIDPTMQQGATDLSGLAVTLLYPMLDLVLIWFLLRMILSGGRLNLSLILMASGFAAFLVSDVWYGALDMLGAYEAGVVDLGWLLGYALWGTAALHPDMARIADAHETTGQLTNRRLVLLSIAATVPAIMAIVEKVLRGHIEPGPVIIGSIVMFGLILLRLFGVLEEQRDLLRAHARLQHTLERLAQEDPLTGLDNRRGFVERVEAALARDAGRAAILILDLDDFKSINDSLGHLVGDDVLRILGRRISGSIRPSDTAARLGGDEFAVLLGDCASTDAALDVGQRLVSALSTPMTIGEVVVTARCSVGVALGTQADDASALIRSADLALYRAKAEGAERVELFDDDLNHDALVATAIREGLGFAAERGELALAYQPIVLLDGRRPLALEALVRWDHPRLGFLMPGDFLKLAESTGQMEGIGRWVLDWACHDAAAWTRSGHRDVAVNVNVSPSQLRSSAFADDVRDVLRRTRLDPRSLTLELTEAALEEVGSAAASLVEIAGLGVRLAIDDFGTGYSSLSRVGALPVAELKLDRSLLRGDQRMLAAIAELGHALGLRIVAEGVETPAELALAEGVGCDAAQGFLLGGAVAVSHLDRVLDNARMPDRDVRPADPQPALAAGSIPSAPATS